MTLPRRVQRRFGLPVPENAVFTGTGSRWRTPFIVGVPRGIRDAGGKGTTVVPESEEQALELYLWYLEASGLDREIHELRGMDLCCWCPPETRCHTDLLLELANPGARSAAA